MTNLTGRSLRALGGTTLIAALTAFGGASLLIGVGAASAQAPTITPEEIKSIVDIDAVKKRAAAGANDYEKLRYDRIHFKPAIDHAKDEACLVCHAEISKAKPRAVSPAHSRR